MQDLILSPSKKFRDQLSKLHEMNKNAPPSRLPDFGRYKKAPPNSRIALGFNKNLEQSIQNNLASRKLHKRLKKRYKNYREPFGTNFSPGNRMKTAVTKSGTKLYRTQTFGFCVILSDNPEAKLLEVGYPKETLAITSTPKKSLKTIRTPPSKSIKKQTVCFTEKYVAELEELKKTKINRNQNQVMTRKGEKSKFAGVTSLAKDLKLSNPGEFWEWLHLIAFMLSDVDGQIPGNLVGGTAYANTLMIPVEKNVLRMAMQLPGHVTLEVAANLIRGTQIASTIDYLILVNRPNGKQLKLPFRFDAQSRIKPDRRVKGIIDELINHIIKCTVQKLEGQGDKLEPLLMSRNLLSEFLPHGEQEKLSANKDSKMIDGEDDDDEEEELDYLEYLENTENTEDTEDAEDLDDTEDTENDENKINKKSKPIKQTKTKMPLLFFNPQKNPKKRKRNSDVDEITGEESKRPCKRTRNK